MTIDTQRIPLSASIWISEVDDADKWVLEGERGTVEAERTDADEVAVHFTLPGEGNAVASIYLPRAQAFALAGVIQMEAARA